MKNLATAKCITFQYYLKKCKKITISIVTKPVEKAITAYTL